MCPECFEEGIYRFISQEDFEQFSDILDTKIKENKMSYCPGLDDNNFMGMDFRYYASCNSCGENWVLDIPDNANRGYFLNKEGLDILHGQRERHNLKVRKNGFILLFVLILIFVLYFVSK